MHVYMNGLLVYIFEYILLEYEMRTKRNKAMNYRVSNGVVTGQIFTEIITYRKKLVVTLT